MKNSFPSTLRPFTFGIVPTVISAVLFFVCISTLTAGGSGEAAGMDRAKHLTGQGGIVKPEDILIDSYISQIDYGYPDPEGDLGVTLLMGPSPGDPAPAASILQIGIQGRRSPFEGLPPLNLVFLLYVSGSMSSEEKIEAGRAAFGVLAGKLREKDIISAVVFADKPAVLIPAAAGNREDLVSRVSGVLPYGRVNFAEGLRAGYAQAAASYKPGMVHRVILVSDGNFEATAELSLIAAEYLRKGIGLTTVTVGTTADVSRMSELARAGGGSSRYMPDAAKAAELFDAGLDRMIVPVAFDLELVLDLPESAEGFATWGYDHRIEGGRIRYFLPALHVRDYETILVEIPGPFPDGPISLRIKYRDWKGLVGELGPFRLDGEKSTGGLESANIRAATMLMFARGLKDIGILHYSAWNDAMLISPLQYRIFDSLYMPWTTVLDDVILREFQEFTLSIEARRKRALDIASGLLRLVRKARIDLGEASLLDEEAIAETYISTIGRTLWLTRVEIESLLSGGQKDRK